MNPSTEEAGLCGLQIQGEARLHKEILAQQIHQLVFRRAGESLESNEFVHFHESELVSWVYTYENRLYILIYNIFYQMHVNKTIKI